MELQVSYIFKIQKQQSYWKKIPCGGICWLIAEILDKRLRPCLV